MTKRSRAWGAITFVPKIILCVLILVIGSITWAAAAKRETWNDE